MYSPSLERFMQADPIGYGDGLNLYAYTHADPINGKDPTGTQTDDCSSSICQVAANGDGYGANPPETGSHILGVDTGASCSGNCGGGSWSLPYYQPNLPAGQYTDIYTGQTLTSDGTQGSLLKRGYQTHPTMVRAYN